MGRGSQKRRRKANKQKQRTREEPDLVREREVARRETLRRELPSTFRMGALAARAGSDPPPILGEPDTPVRAPLKPKPHLRSGAIALLEPPPEDAFLTVNPKSISK
jgi:hypothetical protein